ncbi:MAG: hypothetical protein MJZ84_05225 [Paludibacteraceae bacterium]|nr:hypothetical protein [Paludibacteraceae bacterium]
MQTELPKRESADILIEKVNNGGISVKQADWKCAVKSVYQSKLLVQYPVIWQYPLHILLCNIEVIDHRIDALLCMENRSEQYFIELQIPKSMLKEFLEACQSLRYFYHQLKSVILENHEAYTYLLEHKADEEYFIQEFVVMLKYMPHQLFYTLTQTFYKQARMKQNLLDDKDIVQALLSCYLHQGELATPDIVQFCAALYHTTCYGKYEHDCLAKPLGEENNIIPIFAQFNIIPLRKRLACFEIYWKDLYNKTKNVLSEDTSRHELPSDQEIVDIIYANEKQSLDKFIESIANFAYPTRALKEYHEDLIKMCEYFLVYARKQCLKYKNSGIEQNVTYNINAENVIINDIHDNQNFTVKHG